MRVVSPETTTSWKAALKGGNARPTVRATVEHGFMRNVAYNTANTPGGDYDNVRARKGHFRNIVFGSTRIHEIRNIRRSEWGRSVDQDIAECTLTLTNTELTPIGTNDPDFVAQGEDFELPGRFTFNRGDQHISQSRWGYDSETGWNGALVPDRLVRTYEGYGYDQTVPPGDDPHLYQSGTWLIDGAEYNANGDIVLRMRDLARLLVDHICFPPIVPYDDYPLTWSKIDSVMLPGRDAVGGTWNSPKGSTTSSNNKYIGEGLVDTPKYVNRHGGVQGHYSNHAYDEDPSTFWLSTGQDDYESVVWWEVDFDNVQAVLGAVRFHTRGGPYRVYISIHDQDDWIGRRKVPYDITTGGVDLAADIPYVKSIVAEKGEPQDVILSRKYQNVKKVRLTFTRLRRIAGSSTYPWRAGLQGFKVYTANSAADMSFTEDGEVLTPVGNYRDYTDIIKWCGAWAGFFWPEAGDNFIQYASGGPKVHYTYAVKESILPRGRVWGSFQPTGTAGIADLTPDLFDKQPLLDVIQYVRDLTGFSFWIDECGGMVWRMPNLYALGNYVSHDHKTPRYNPTRTTDIVTIDENETLKSYSTTLSSRNLRERVFVASSTGKIGAVVKGFNPYPTGLRRIAGWTDQHFATRRECRVAADMIVARQMFDYRRASITIPANPAIQIDDQIRIFERVTNETYYHYVLGVSSTLDMDEGTWDYSLETHWLGERPSDAWVVKVDQLDPATQAYLNTIGAVQ